VDRILSLNTETVHIEIRQRVGLIRFNRPERRNALHDEMYGPIIEAIHAFSDDPEVGCIVVTGEGVGFCAGGDVREGSGRRSDGSRPSLDERAENLARNAELVVALHEAPIVTIAAVNGAAVGAGMAIALACDVRIASTSATFIGGWARLGFSGDFGGAWLLRHRVGPSKALEILATNRTVTAVEALEIGMVDHLVEEKLFADACWDMARSFADGPRSAISFMKQNILDADRLDLSQAILQESRRMVDSSQTQDHREGVRAWVEKREPRFGLPE